MSEYFSKKFYVVYIRTRLIHIRINRLEIRICKSIWLIYTKLSWFYDSIESSLSPCSLCEIHIIINTFWISLRNIFICHTQMKIRYLSKCHLNRHICKEKLPYVSVIFFLLFLVMQVSLEIIPIQNYRHLFNSESVEKNEKTKKKNPSIPMI